MKLKWKHTHPLTIQLVKFVLSLQHTKFPFPFAIYIILKCCRTSFEKTSGIMILYFLFQCSAVFVGRPGTQIPNLLTPKDIDSSTVLLRKEYAWHIGGALSQHELEDWKLLYHSSVNGLSFNTFLGNIS